MSDEEVKKLDEKIKILEQKKKVLEYKLTNEDRKSRTRRLIQKGALLEKYLNLENVSIEETEIVLKVLSDFRNKNSEYFNRQLEKVIKNKEGH